MTKLCAIEDCGRQRRASGLCGMHYQRWRKHGDPRHVEPRNIAPVLSGAASPHWTGNAVGYDAAHNRVKALRGPAKNHQCRHCTAPAAHWAYDKTDPNERVDGKRGCAYSADPNRYLPLCVSCHWRFDGAAARLRRAAA